MNNIKKIIKGFIGFIENNIDNPKIDKNIKYFIIGKTNDGNNIKCYKFGKGEDKILYMGGFHGNEVGTVKLMVRWINFLSKNKNIICKNKTLFVIDCLNIDGYNLALQNPDYYNGGVIGKLNTNNVDLNRNFPSSNWQKESKVFIMGKYYSVFAGKSAGSEPEVNSLVDLIEKENIKTIYEFHNCWGNVMSNFRESSDFKTIEYIKHSGFNHFTKDDWDSLDELHKTGNINIWGYENDIDVIEIENRTRYASEWKNNKNALINSINL